MIKQELIERIQQLPFEHFHIGDMEQTTQGISGTLPDVRMGAIYPPIPMEIMEYSTPDKFKTWIEFY